MICRKLQNLNIKFLYKINHKDRLCETKDHMETRFQVSPHNNKKIQISKKCLDKLPKSIEDIPGSLNIQIFNMLRVRSCIQRTGQKEWSKLWELIQVGMSSEVLQNVRFNVSRNTPKSSISSAIIIYVINSHIPLILLDQFSIFLRL